MRTFIISLLCLVLISCSETNIIIDGNGSSNRKMNLIVKNTDFTQQKSSKVSEEQVSNLQILLFDANNKCIKTILLSSVTFDENNLYSTNLIIPNTTTSITVLGNAIGYTYPPQSLFNGTTVQNIFLSTTHDATIPPHYYFQPKVFYQGNTAVTDLTVNGDIVARVDISRVVSKIVMQLAQGLNFTDNGGEGFRVVETPIPVFINGIDSVFVVDTPPGVNISFTEYLSSAVGFDYCQIFKPTTFLQDNTGKHRDSIIVFPQINATKLPFLIFSVTGSKAGYKVGARNPLYYGMRIKNLTYSSGITANLTSLPRNVVIIVTINNFVGVGSATHPNPDYQDMLELTVVVKSWEEYYNAGGNAE